MTNTTTIDEYYEYITNLYEEGYFTRKGGWDVGFAIDVAKKIEETYENTHPTHPEDNTGQYSKMLGFILFLMTERNGWEYEEMMDAISQELWGVYQITQRSKKLKEKEVA